MRRFLNFLAVNDLIEGTGMQESSAGRSTSLRFINDWLRDSVTVLQCINIYQTFRTSCGDLQVYQLPGSSGAMPA